VLHDLFLVGYPVGRGGPREQ